MLRKQIDIVGKAANAERAVDEFRRGRGAVLHEFSKERVFFPVEFLDETLLGVLHGLNLKWQAIVTGGRAKSLGLSYDRDRPVAFDGKPLTLAQWHYLADPTAAKVELPNLPTQTPDDDSCRMLALAKHASLLPALLCIEGLVSTHELVRSWQRLTPAQLQHYFDEPQLETVPAAQAKLPVEGAEQTTITGFRTPHGAAVHLALVVGDITTAKDPLVRVHSSCVTGDILGSLRCDCGDQLTLALGQIIDAGAGVLIYLHQEGRGIGIVNKLRAYRLQEQGVDTYDANVMLGFEEDERDFSIAAGILKHLGLKRVKLLTNNPVKIDSLKKRGIDISERVPLLAASGRHNHAYMETKAKKSGHLF